LDGPGAALENQMIFLKVSHVERSNVQETLLNGKRAAHKTAGSSADGSQNKAREEKIRALKEMFLRERASTP
jgi:ribosomal protein L12E/L44/L45/RPP1/RPP2